MRLVGTTKATLQAIRDRTHWNSASLTPMDPVTLGLCSQIDLDMEVNRAAKDRPLVEADQGPTLAPAEITTAPKTMPTTQEEVFGKRTEKRVEQRDEIDVDSVFAKLKDLQDQGIAIGRWRLAVRRSTAQAFRSEPCRRQA